jgi:glycosyltransferase involved in cell wall biosynthesis
MKILVVNDLASSAYTLQKYYKDKVDVIYFSEHPTISQVKEPKFFVKGKGLYSQIKQIKKMSREYDVFLCFGWMAAAICYLAKVNYVIYFVDSYIDPKDRIRRKTSSFKKILLENLYKDALDNASLTVTGILHDARILQKYRSDGKIVLPFMDDEMFNPNVKTRELDQDKFIFLSPQRIDPGKEIHIIWNAVELTKSDFIVLQTDWGSGDYYNKILKTKPSKIKLIPKIKRQDMPSYLVSSDALLGQISMTCCGSSEREAALCNKPVFCYVTQNVLQNVSENDPFYRESKDPKEIAAYIDKIVLDKEFREQLALTQNSWIKRTFDNKKTITQWEKMFEEAVKKKPMYHVKIKYKLIFKILSIIENLIHRDLSSIGRNIE